MKVKEVAYYPGYPATKKYLCCEKIKKYVEQKLKKKKKILITYSAGIMKITERDLAYYDAIYAIAPVGKYKRGVVKHFATFRKEAGKLKKGGGGGIYTTLAIEGYSELLTHPIRTYKKIKSIASYNDPYTREQVNKLYIEGDLISGWEKEEWTMPSVLGFGHFDFIANPEYYLDKIVNDIEGVK